MGWNTAYAQILHDTNSGKVAQSGKQAQERPAWADEIPAGRGLTTAIVLQIIFVLNFTFYGRFNGCCFVLGDGVAVSIFQRSSGNGLYRCAKGRNHSRR